MAEKHERRIVAADRLENALIITFDDGRCAEFSSTLLYAMLSEAKELFESQDFFHDDESKQADSQGETLTT